MRRIVVYVAMGVAVEGSVLAGGCSDGPRPSVGDKDPIVRGTIGMELQTVSDSGKVYRLRQAVFPVDPQGSVVFGGGGFPIALPPIDAGVSAGGFFGAGGAVAAGGIGTGGSSAGGAFPATGGTVGGSHTLVLSSEDDPTKTVLEAFVNPGSYQVQLLDGWFVEQVDELLGTATPVSADLLSSSIQFFDIQSDNETFVKFDFDVDGRRVTFGPPGRLIVGIGVHERNGGCGNGVIDPGEACDGADLGFESCASVTMGAFPGGTLLCSSFCTFDTSFCFANGDAGVGGFGGTFGGDAAAGAAGASGFGGTFDGGAGGTPVVFDGGASAGKSAQ